MVHQEGIGGHEFSVGRLAGCRIPFIESTLTALGLSQPTVVYTCTNQKMQTTKSRRTQNTPRNPQQLGNCDHIETASDETHPTR